MITVVFCTILAMSSNALPQHDPSTPEQRAESWAQHQRLKESSLFKELTWRAVGPRKQGGRIEAIAVPPGNHGTIYVGAGSGNIWKTVNNGTTWKPIFEEESTFSIGDIAVARTDPNIVWVGTGEVLMARSSFAGTGVFKSTDAGESWQNMGLADTHHISKVLIHPDDAETVFVAAAGHLYSDNKERGVFKTTDGGKSWRKVLYIDEKTGVMDMVMEPGDPSTMYATSWEHTRKAWGHTDKSAKNGVYKSTDGGENWTRLTELPTNENVGRIAVDVSASKPNVVYVLLGASREDQGVYRSDDRGETWNHVSDQMRAGYDFCIIKVSPDSADTIYVPGFETFYSTDGGETFAKILGTLVHLLEHGSTVLHLDAHEFWIDPENPNRVMLGNDGGFHISYDRGLSWLHLNNLPIGEFYAVSYDMDEPYNIYGGTQDDAALFGPAKAIEEDRPDPWQHVYLDRWGGGDSYFTYRDPTDPDVIYYENQFGALRRKNMKTGKSQNIQPRVKLGQPALRYNWMSPFFISHYEPSTVYFAANKLFKSTDRGNTWKATSEDLTSAPKEQGNVPFGTVTSLSESPLQQGLIYAGADDGYLHVTRDDGASWSRIDFGISNLWVSRVLASQFAIDRVYVTMTGYRFDDFAALAFVSEDGGESWTAIKGNLPSESVNVIIEDPRDENVLYVGTDLGVYVSLDKGLEWHSLCNSLPTTPVHDLAFHPREFELIAGTHGRSVFVMDVTSLAVLDPV